MEGKPKTSSGTWETYLYEDKGYHVHITEDASRGQRAITHFTIKGVHHRYTLLELTLETERKIKFEPIANILDILLLGIKNMGENEIL